MNEIPSRSLGHASICPECGAECPPDVKACWLCKAPLEAAITTAELVSRPAEKSDAATFDQLAIMVTGVIMGLVVSGVFAAVPGVGVLFGGVAALAMIAIVKASKVGTPPRSNAKSLKYAYNESATQSAVTQQNRILKIVLIVVGSIMAVLVSAVGIAILLVIAMCAAIASFFEQCFGLIQPPG